MYRNILFTGRGRTAGLLPSTWPHRVVPSLQTHQLHSSGKHHSALLRVSFRHWMKQRRGILSDRSARRVDLLYIACCPEESTNTEDPRESNYRRTTSTLGSPS